MHLKKIIPFIIALVALPFFMKAQVTTSSITGIAKTASGPLAGASITATHIPTGTVYTSLARTGGRFDINNMNPGGPYRITATFSGFDANTKEDIYLVLGETQRLDFDLSNKTTELTTVVVAGRRGAASLKTGAETNINRSKLDVIPSVGRNISDFVKFVPQVKIGNASASQAISIGGQNNRYNSFLIDGSVNNDVFGLAASGTNGGQAAIAPISIDAIDQLIVQISPYDAAIGNFTGGAINAITKSGTNTFHGSAYYIFRNEKLAGKTAGQGLTASQRVRYPDFKNQTYGVTIGGPILKNKAFFFINAEKQKDVRPQPYTGPEGPVIDSINKLKDYVRTKYNYDLGDFRNNEDKIDRTNVNTRFDFNLTSKQKLTFSYRYNKGERINPSRSSYNGSTGSIAFTNGAQYFPSTTHSGNIELNSKFSNTKNNKFRIAYTKVLDDRAFVGDPFPAVTIAAFNGGPSYNFGSEASSTVNLLKQTILNFYDAFKIYAGKHALTAGADLDFNKSYNIFLNRNFSLYTYSALGTGATVIGPLQAFMENRGPSRIQRQYSLVDPPGKAGDDGSVNAGANFKSVRLGFFVNDDIKLTSNFTLTVGLRADKTSFTTAVPVDPFFRDSARPVIAKYYDLEDANTGQKFQPKFMFSPRVGFKYNVEDANVILRGGIGIFAGRTPLVWPGGIYQNPGTLAGQLDTARTSAQLTASGTQYGIQQPAGTPYAFNPDVNTQPTQQNFGLPASLSASQGDVNIISKKFKLPAALKASLAADKRFGKGWTFTTELLFTKNINEIDFINVNFVPQEVTNLKTTGPEVRDIYPTSGATKLIYRPTGGTALIRNPYSNVILIRNTHGRKGYAYNFTFQINKETQKGFQFNASYTYGNSQVHNEATSSVNVSNWQNMETVRGRNYLPLTTSDNDLGHRIFALASKKFTYARQHAATTITFTYNGQSGSPFSYVNGPSTSSIVGDGSNGNDLMYIPASRAEMDQMVFTSKLTGAAATPAANAANIIEQKDQFEDFINNDKYLRKHRGQFAERNGARLPFTNIIDANITQDFMMKVGQTTHKLSVALDIFNLTNLIDKNAGRIYFLNFDQASPLSFRGFQTGTTTPTYQFFKPNNNKPWVINDAQTSPNTSARWQGAVTIRYSF